MHDLLPSTPAKYQSEKQPLTFNRNYSSPSSYRAFRSSVAPSAKLGYRQVKTCCLRSIHRNRYFEKPRLSHQNERATTTRKPTGQCACSSKWRLEEQEGQSTQTDAEEARQSSGFSKTTAETCGAIWLRVTERSEAKHRRNPKAKWRMVRSAAGSI